MKEKEEICAAELPVANVASQVGLDVAITLRSRLKASLKKIDAKDMQMIQRNQVYFHDYSERSR